MTKAINIDFHKWILVILKQLQKLYGDIPIFEISLIIHIIL